MCMEDIRLGRQLGSIVTVVPCPDAGDTPILKADPLRTRIVVSVPPTGNAVIFPGQNQAVSGVGFSLTPQAPVLTLRVEEWGNVLCQAWFGSGVGAAATLSILESTLEKR